MLDEEFGGECDEVEFASGNVVVPELALAIIGEGIIETNDSGALQRLVSSCFALERGRDVVFDGAVGSLYAIKEAVGRG